MNTNQINARKALRKLANDGKFSEICKAFDKTLTKHPDLGKYSKCPQCETSTPHIEGECQFCGWIIDSPKKSRKGKPSLQMAFEVTEDDVETVIDQFIASTKRLIDKNSLDATEIFANHLQVDLVSACALQGDDLNEQTNLAHKEIKRQIEILIGFGQTKKVAKKRKVVKKPKQKSPPNGCPKCKSEDIEYGDITIDGTESSQKCRCQECDVEWFDVYKYSHRQVI